MKFTLIFLALLLSSHSVRTQNIWNILSQVKYKKIVDANLGFEVDYPIFSAELKSYECKEIVVKGFIIPRDGYKSHTEFVLSALPVKSCYFCGGAGPETVIEVIAKNGIPFTADKIELKGTLKLNTQDLNRLMFQLTNAERTQ